MLKRWVMGLLASIVVTAAAPLVRAADTAGLPARLIVRYSDALPTAQLSAQSTTERQNRLSLLQARVDRLSALGGRPFRHLRSLASGSELVDAGTGLDRPGLERLAEQIRRSAPAGLVRVEPDRVLTADFTPNDPQIANQWGAAGPAQSFGAAGVNAYPAWDTTSGSGAVVAVIDTGYRPHADLAGQVIAQYDFIGDTTNANDGDGRDGNAQDPGDYRSNGQCGGSASNSSWHGTHTAGTIAALGNNALGVAGIAYSAKLVIARVLGACGGYTSDISDAIVWASGGTVSGVPANPHPAQVINMSLGGQYPCSSSPEMQSAIDSARSRNTTVVVAAGNSSSDASGFTPASCTGVIAVAAVGESGNRAYYSNYGSLVAVAAPGGDTSSGAGIISTYNSGATTPGADSYAYLQGTSMATPHVAGVAALLYSVNPSLTPDAVATAIKTSARPFTGSCSACGTGLVDATAALAAIAPGHGSFSFSAASSSIAENGGSATITVQRTGGNAGAVTVAYATSNGTATAGSDYSATSGTLSWADGDSSAKTFSVPITDDSTPESTETINLTLSSPTGSATLGSVRSAVLSIIDNDSATGTLSFAAASYSVAENAGTVTVSVSRSGGSNGAASVDYSTANGSATAGSDYTSKSGTLIWAAGDTSTKTFTVAITNDTLAEPSETIQLKLANPSGATLGGVTTSTVTIIDDDTPSAAGVIAVSSAVASVAENAGSVSITVTRTGGSTGAVSVSYAMSNGTATAGSDYTASTGTLTWAAGSAVSKTISIPIIDDTIPEANETFTLTLSNPSGGATLGSNKAAVVTIVDNDGSPGAIALSSATYSIGEAGGAVTITLTRTGGSTGAASVNYATANGTALAGSDYVANGGTITWANGDAASKTFTVSILNDTLKESAETFQVRLSGAITATLGSIATSTVTIIDND